MLYLSKKIFASTNQWYFIDQNNPNASEFYRGSFEISTSAGLVIWFNLDDAVKRDLYEAKLSLDVGLIYNSSGEKKNSANINIELYSGNSDDLLGLTYNKLSKYATKYNWYGTTSKIKKTITANSYQNIDISEGISGLSQAIDSGEYVLVFVRAADSGERINVEIADSVDACMDVYAYSLAPVISNPSPNGITVYKNKEQFFSWTYNGDGSAQKLFEIGWSADNGSTWNNEIVESSNRTYKFDAETFPEGTIQWRVKSTSEEGLSSEYLEAEFYTVAQKPSVIVEFPNAINIPNERDQIFTWDYFGEDLAQISYEIGWSSDGGNTWNSIEVISSETYHVFAAGTFPTGAIIWRIRSTNSDGYESEYAYGAFQAVGQSEAPVIETVTQDAIPSITWSASNQEAFEVEIVGNDLNYASGMIAGEETRTFQPNIMLPDGKYIVKVRMLNIYGIISEWGESMLVLETEKPNSSPVLTLRKNDFYGAELSGSGISGRGFFVRKENGKETIIAEYVPGKAVIDCDLQLGKNYTYVLRDYSGGYTDSPEESFVCDITGVLFHDVEDLSNMIHICLNESEDVNVESALSKNTVYKQCVGREFPVKESSIQKSEEMTVTGFMTKEQYHKAYNMYILDKIVLFRHENYCCYADMSDFKKQNYFDMGYIVKIVFVRLDRNDEVKLV